MKNRYSQTVRDLQDMDDIVHLFFYDREDVMTMEFTPLASAFERPWLLNEIEEHGIGRCSIYALEEQWKTSI